MHDYGSAPARPAKGRKKYESWEVRDALATITRATEIRKDKQLMALVRKEAARQYEAAKAARTNLKGA